VAPAKIAILVPSVNAYRPIIGAIATEYGVPVEYERPLLGNPAVAALVNLLKLAPSFPWQLTLDALRSPNIRQSWLSEEQIGLLDQLSRERPVLAGRDQWAFAVRPLTLETQDNNDDDFGPPPLVARLDPIDLMAINDGMTAFFEHLTPADTASYRDYTWWLQTAIIGFIPETDGDEEGSLAPVPTLDLLGCSLESSFALRDRNALEVVMRAIRRLLASSETVPLDAEISWETYRDELLGILQVMQIPPDRLQASVRFGRLDEGRARVCDYLFVLGLSEGEFPTPPPADALYAPLERETHPLPLIRFSPADDASLWWQVIGNVNTQLFLLRPYIDANGAPWQTSPYWDAVRACFCDLPVENIPIAEQRLPMDAANQSELLVALAQAGATAIPESLRKHWLYAQHTEGVMQRRQGYLPPGEFEGVIQAPSIQAELAARYGDLHVWSASRLNRYANCPYGFFAEQVLKLKALQDTEEGLDAMQRGILLHAILEELYNRLTRLEIAPTQDSVETILGQLEASCAVVFPSAPQRYGFRPSPLWQYEQKELLRLLRALVVWECEENGSDARFRPYLQEAGFGIRESGPQPLAVMGEKAQFRLRGLIDRIDRDPAGNLRVIDYKSGSTTWSTNDLKKGLALQTTLYALAAERFWSNDESHVAESHYWHIPSREASGSLKISACVTQDELADAIIQQAAWNIFQIRSGVFPSAPGKPVQGGMSCNSRCDFAPICRVSRLSIGKARRGGLG
jgi:ATP-dependent helicase/nuclease subunit B